MENETPTDANNVLAADLSTLIDIYKVRLAKIEKATNAISEWSQEKAWKASAAKQTKRFLSDLRRLQKRLSANGSQVYLVEDLKTQKL